jgi:signal transduction histidine kinase
MTPAEPTQKLEELDRRNAELSLLLELGQEVVSALDVTQVLQAGAHTAARSLRCSCAYVFLPNQSGTALRVAAREEPDPEVDARVGTELPLEQEWLTGLCFKTQQVQVSTDTRTDPRVAPEIAHRFGCNATLAVPLLSHGRTLGVLSLFERTGRIFDPLDVRLATHAANLISSALENAQLYQDLRRSYAELERTQKELIDRERLAALGALSASIAHEVRNPLGVIFNSVGSLRRLLKPSGDVALLLDIVGEEADRLNRMVGDLLDYSRPVRPSLEPVPLGPLLEEALAAARDQIGAPAEAVKVDIRIAAGVATVRADARLLRQALINLFLNAYQAMPRGGQLEVRATHRAQDTGAVAEVAIRDSGPGIPPESREKIFQPFFTTKAMGTGLGLAVVRRIVEGHGGTIVLASSAAGAEFHLQLPIDG